MMVWHGFRLLFVSLLYVDMGLIQSLFVLLIITPLCCGERPSSGESRGRRLRSRDIASVKTIVTEEGDTVDCVGIYDQPAFSHPALKGHAVQLMPSSLLNHDIDRAMNVSYKLPEPCPRNAVPIPLVRKEDLIIERTRPGVALDSKNRNCDLSDLNQIVDFSRILWVDGANPIEHGGGAILNTRNLSVAKDRFASINLVVQGGRDGQVDAISAGWMVDQRGLARFFTYWTGDINNDGCDNLDCPGFVQTSSEIALDAVISSEGDRPRVQVIILQDPLTRHWWLAYDGNFIGYWPKELFGHLYDGATLLDWRAASNYSACHPHTSEEQRFSKQGYKPRPDWPGPSNP